MLKKFNFTSPLGIALTVGGLFLALSPEVRRSVRKLMVKGTAGVMDAMDHLNATPSGVVSDQALTWKSSPKEVSPALTAPQKIPVPTEDKTMSSETSVQE